MKITHQNVWFISDLHLNHANIIKYDNLDFSSIEEHDETIVNNWNKLVKPDDLVFHLGDFCFGGSDTVKKFINRLNGQKVFIKGNHEKPLCNYLKSAGLRWYDYLEIKVLDEDLPRKWQDICLFHYPIYEFNKGHHGSWMIHGHCHGNCEWSQNSNYKIMDVGANVIGFKPISYKELKRDMKNKTSISHH